LSIISLGLVIAGGEDDNKELQRKNETLSNERQKNKDLRPKNGVAKPFNPLTCGESFVLNRKVTANTTQSMVQFFFAIQDGSPTFRVTTTDKGESGLEDTKTRNTFKVSIEGVLEVPDNLPYSNLTFDKSVRSVGFHRLAGNDKAKWTKLNCSVSTVSGATLYKASTRLKFINHPTFLNLNFSLDIQVSDQFLNLGQGAVDPNGQKYSILIDGWPYSKPNTHLAIIKSVWAKSRTVSFTNGTKVGNSTASNGQLIVDDKFGLVDWDSTIQADGVTSPVIVSDLFRSIDVDEDGDSDKLLPKLLAFHLPRAKTLFWDPYLGLSSDNSALEVFLLIQKERLTILTEDRLTL